MFAIVATPYDAYQNLPGRLFKLLVSLSRYSNRAGECWPSLRQLAGDAMTSITTTWRDLNDLESRGCFTRERRGRGRFFYTIAEAYRPRWPERQPSDSRVSSGRNTGVPQRETPEAYPLKYQDSAPPRARFAKSGEKSAEPPETDWEMRLRCWRKSRFWMPFWGPKPSERGCFAPPELLAG